MKKALIFIGVYLLCVVHPAEAELPTTETTAGSLVRVLISQGQTTVKLTIAGGYLIRDFKTKKNLSDSHGLQGVNIRSAPGNIIVAGVKFPPDIDILCDKSTDLYINDQPFRGYLSVHLNVEGTLEIVNHIDLEEYLYGVLFHEVGAWWPMEALKAQAVASRSYALFQQEERKTRLFDVFNNQSSQMYGGADSERPRSNDAVDQTRAQVLVYEGKILPAFYHATCGGMTRDASELWNVDLKPLKGGVHCQSCWFSPHYSWHAQITGRELEGVLEDRGEWMGVVRDIKVNKRSPSGRVLLVVIAGPNGRKTISAKDLRLWVGPTLVRSENFDVHLRRGKVFFEGKGWGHGVGMCQWGALGQSIMRKKYDEILSFYYPGSEIRVWGRQEQ